MTDSPLSAGSQRPGEKDEENTARSLSEKRLSGKPEAKSEPGVANFKGLC
jgi:hypothetical protein